MTSEIQTIGDVVEQSKTEIVKAISSADTLPLQLTRNETVDVSVFGGHPASFKEIEEKIVIHLASHFSKMSPIVLKDIAKIVCEEKWPAKRIDFAIRKLISERHYPQFQAADFLQCDKYITFGKSETALRRKLKFTISQSEIVVVKVERKYTDDDGIEQKDWMKVYAYKDEAEDVMPNRIIGRWDDDRHEFVYSGENFYDHTIKVRQNAFKCSLYKFCDSPPYNGKYETDVVRRFYEHYAQVLPPGDMLLFEKFMHFDAEQALFDFNNKLKQQN